MVETNGSRSLADIVRAQARRRPDAPALDVDGRALTFAELHDRSSRLAAGLARLGVGPGDRVGFLGKNGVEYFETVFAVAKLRAVTVAVNWRLTPGEIAHVLDDAGVRVVVVVGPDLTGHVRVIESTLATAPKIVSVGGGAGWEDFDALLDASPSTDPGLEGQPDDVVLQLYTSGTTGAPKGVMITNRNLFDGVMQLGDAWRLSSDAVNLAVMPMFHIAGCGWALVGMNLGCRTVVLPDVDPAQILAVIPEFGVTNVLLVPAVIRLLLQTPEVTATDLSTLRAIVYGASPIADAVLIEAMEQIGCEFIQVYGMTETSGAITQLEPTDHDALRRPELLRSCGREHAWVEIRIVDPDSGVDVPGGDVGELWTRSAQNMAGYWNDQATTDATIDPNGWLRTGDAGYRDEGGYLYLYDRVKDMIVTGAENVYPAEVENVLASHPDVADVAVIGVPDAHWGEAVKAMIVRRAGSEPTEGELLSFARDHLAGFKVPKSVDFTDVLPRNASGKLLKREIRGGYWDGATRQIG
jgi:long-chain acyl-CoA synthetase